MRVLAITGSPPPRLAQHGPAPRPARGGARRASSSSSGTGCSEIPPYDEDDDVEPGPARSRRSARCVREADAVFFATPEYNSSIPGALKNALDWASRPLATNAFRNKPVAVIGSSAGVFGGVWAQAELRKVLAAMGARVAEVELAVGHAHEKFDADGKLVDDEVRDGSARRSTTLLAEARSAPASPLRLASSAAARPRRAAAARPSARARRRAFPSSTTGTRS